VRDLLQLQGFKTTLFLNLAYLWFVAAIFDTLLPLFASDELGMSTGAIGTMFAVGVAAEFLVLFPAGTWADRYGRKAVMVPSLAGLVVMILLLGTSSSPIMLTLLLAVLAFCSGFAGVPPAAMLSDIVPTEQSGRGVGAFRFCGDIGFFLGPLIAGAVSERFGFQTAFAVIAIVPAVAVALTIRIQETLPGRRAPERLILRAEVIATDRLMLDPLRAQHAEEMVEVLADPRLHEFIGGSPPTPEELRQRYASLENGRSPDGRERWLNWIVRRRSDGRAVGTVQATLRSTPTDTSADIAWTVGVPWQRRGFASEAAIAMVGWLEGGGVSVVCAYIHPGHRASERVAAAAGLSATREVVDGERLWRRVDRRE
jgi:RimJ/RimL family protein N-acetyltransferase